MHADVHMQCAMAVAIKKELLEDEERQQSKIRRVTQENSPDRNHQLHEAQNGHNDMDISLSNGHHGKGTTEPQRNNNEDPLEDREEEEEVDEEDLRRHEFRTHLFLASVSSHQQKQHQQSQNHDPQDASISNDSAGNSLFHVPCPLCQVPLEQRVFRQHLDRHYPRDSPVCPVIQCGRRFAHPNSVRNHMRLKHAVQWLKMKAMRSSGGPFIGLNNSVGEHAIATTTTSSNPFTKQEFL